MNALTVYNLLWSKRMNGANYSSWWQDTDYSRDVDFEPLVTDRDLTAMNNILIECSAFVVSQIDDGGAVAGDAWTVGVQMPYPTHHYHCGDVYSYSAVMEIAGAVADVYGKEIIVRWKEAQ